jgi:hypothetical protein
MISHCMHIESSAVEFHKHSREVSCVACCFPLAIFPEDNSI